EPVAPVVVDATLPNEPYGYGSASRRTAMPASPPVLPLSEPKTFVERRKWIWLRPATAVRVAVAAEADGGKSAAAAPSTTRVRPTFRDQTYSAAVGGDLAIASACGSVSADEPAPRPLARRRAA